jgi:hypothetical protein
MQVCNYDYMRMGDFCYDSFSAGSIHGQLIDGIDFDSPGACMVLEHLERVRQHCVEQFSASSLYQAAAARDPEYWNKFSPGGVNL